MGAVAYKVTEAFVSTYDCARVTSILKDTEDKSFVLMKWAKGEMKKFLEAKKSKVYEGAKKCEEEVFGEKYSKLLNDAEGASNRKSGKALDVGSIVHDLAERYIKDPSFDYLSSPDYVSNEQVQVSFAAFLEWYKKYFKGLLLSEVVVCKSYAWGAVAGRLDLVFEMKDGRNAIADFKTSTAVYDSHITQLGAYFGLLNNCLGRRISVRMPKSNEGFLFPKKLNIDCGFILRLPKDGAGLEVKEISKDHLRDRARLFDIMAALHFYRKKLVSDLRIERKLAEKKEKEIWKASKKSEDVKE